MWRAENLPGVVPTLLTPPPRLLQSSMIRPTDRIGK